MHTGVFCGQSVSARQLAQVLSVAQNFPGCVAQSAFPRHSTQIDWLALQAGVLPEHCADDVQPGMHVNVRGLQIGLATPQSELPRHATHRPSAARQRGGPEEQSESVAHCTHCRVVASQTLSAPPQSCAEVHSTHVPALESQMRAAFGQSCEDLHAA